MSSMVESAIEHVAVDHPSKEKLLEEEEKKPPEKEEKNSGKEDKKEPQVSSSTREKTQVPVDTNEPTSEGDNAVIKKDQIEENLLAVAEEDDGKVKLQEKKVKKRKKIELQQIKQQEMVSDAKDFDILGWWEMHGPKYPVISCIARDVLAIQASTVASESSFSAGGRILTDHRSRLKSKMVEALVCLQDWLKAADPKTMNKDAEEEECLVFYQLKECHEETAAQQAKDGTSENLLT